MTARRDVLDVERAPVPRATFAVRGSLVDVWPPHATAGDGVRDEPVRIEFYDDLVVSLKRFDPFEQRTHKEDGLAEIA